MSRPARALAALCLLGLAVLSATRFLPVDRRPVVAVASFSTYAVLGYAALLVAALVVLAVGAARRRRAARRDPVLLAVAATVGLLVHATTLAPLLTGGPRPDGQRFTLLTANLEIGQGDPRAVVRAVDRRGVDVLALEEVTPTSWDRLRAAGLLDRLPHHVGRPSTGADGTVLLSRWPLGRATPVDLGNGGLLVDVRAPTPFRVLAAHTAMPLLDTPRWAADLATLRRTAAGVRGPLVVAGDLNATRDHAAFRSVLDAGLREAGEEAGSGWQPTWPSRWAHAGFRPVIAIDHVLVSSRVRAVATGTVPVPSSDHAGLWAELALPRG